MTPHRLLAGLALAVSITAGAQPAIYRCGNEYTRVPCSNGKEFDARNSALGEERRAEARRVAAEERKLADDMANDRRRAEAAIKPAMAGSLGPQKVAVAQTKSSSAKAKKGKNRGKTGNDEGDFVSTLPKVKAKA